MKIGIVTWFNAPNYGTFLQAYALQQFLLNNGFDSDLINFKPKTFIFSDVRNIVFSLFPFLRNKNTYSNSKFIFQKTVNKSLKLSNRITLKNSRNLNKFYDIFISGSDQIWNPEGLYKSFYMLDFCIEKKCISFSSSLGGNDIPEMDKKLYINLLQKYSYISVREESSKIILEKLLNRKIDHLCDPVFLLSKEEWQKVEKKNKSLNSKKYIFCYFLGYQDFYIQKLKELKSLYPSYEMKMVILGNENLLLHADFINSINSLSPFEFLFLLDNCEFVITDSFHATVFSLIFNKPFYHFLRFIQTEMGGQNQRCYELLKNTFTEKFLITTVNSEFVNINEFPIDNIKYLNDTISVSKEQLLKEIRS